MSDLTAAEKRRLERLLGMGSGYVLNFSNRTFDEFVQDTTGRAIYDDRYGLEGGSKANRLRGFWKVESNQAVGKLLGELLDYGVSERLLTDQHLLDECRKVALRLAQGSPVPELDALTTASDEPDFEAVAKAIRELIDKNDPAAGLDRLHTFVVKFVRGICERSGIVVDRDKPLHSVFGEYVRQLRAAGHIEADMTERILKSSIAILEAFNHVRNNQSLAHDNVLLNYDEALLIFNHVAGSIRFLRSLEARLKERDAAEGSSASAPIDDEIPF